MLKVAGGVKAAAGQEHIRCADCGCVAKGHAYVEIIIVLQIRTVNDTEDVVLMLVPVFVRKLGGDLLQLVRKAVRAGDVIAIDKGGCYGLPVFQTVLP